MNSSELGDFSQIENCYIHVINLESGSKLVSYELTNDYKGKKGIVVL